MRTRIAILMAVIATFGAVVAYRAVTAEEDTSSGERHLEQGQILELNRRADLLNTYRESAQFGDSEKLAASRGFYLQEQAAKLRPTNSSAANSLDLQAEEQFTIARMYHRTGEFTYVGINPSDEIETAIEKKVATELSEAGYGAVWNPPEQGKSTDIWRDLNDDIAKNRKKTVRLSGLVAIFVLSLAGLTFTQLPRDGSPLQLRLERLAYVIAVVALIACLAIDGHSWLPFLLAGVGVGIVALLGHFLYEWPGVKQWLNGPKEVLIPEKESAKIPQAKNEAEIQPPPPQNEAESTKVAPVTAEPAPQPAAADLKDQAAIATEPVAHEKPAVPDQLEAELQTVVKSSAALPAELKTQIGGANPDGTGSKVEKENQAGKENQIENQTRTNPCQEEEASHPHEVGPRIAFIGAHLLAWDCTSTMNRFALSLIAVTALLAAICGWRYDCATAYANGCAARAMDHQVEAFKDAERNQNSLHYSWGLAARMHESRIRYKAAEQRMALAHEKVMGVTADRERSQMDWQKRLLSQNDSAVRNLDSEAGPELDPYYPQKEAELSGREASEAASARWDAENELRQAWHLKGAQYLLTLTMFAIALYLLGQSMGMGLGRSAFILVLGGSLIASVGAFCALKTMFRYLPRDATKYEAAAELYGAGRQIFVVAHDGQDFQQAAEKFDEALKVRPTFALAHYYLGESLYNSARLYPDEQDSLPSRSSGALGKTVREMGLSLDEFDLEGVTPPEELVGRFGFFSFLQSLSPADLPLLKRGIAVLQQGTKSYPHDSWLEENLAVSLLIAGQMADANKTYNDAIRDGMSPTLAIAALGDLEIARSYCTSFPPADCATISSAIAQLKPRFVQVAGPEPAGVNWETRHPSLVDPELSVSPAIVSWKATVNDMDDDQDLLLVIWYWKDPDWNAWRVVSSVSGRVKYGYLSTDSSQRQYRSISYLDTTGEHRCLGGGDYRAEFYLNGKLVAEQSKSMPLAHEFRGVGLYDTNFEVCYPSTWSGWAYTPTDVTGAELVRGSMSPDKKRRVYLFTFFYPAVPGKSSTILQYAVSRAAKIMEQHGLPRDLRFSPIGEPCPAYPVDDLAMNASWFQDSTRVSTARAWIAEDGIVYVSISANAAKTGLDTDDCLLMTSVSNIYAPTEAPVPSAAANSASDSPAGSDAAANAAAPLTDQPNN
jgi:tetratricopeptide (TPR) repeat protein